jgi:hypothetical protein
VNTAGSCQPNEDRENIPPPVENLAPQAQPQDQQHVGMGYYYMGNDFLPPQGHRDHIIGNYAGIAQDVSAQAPAAPPAPVCI